MISRAVEHPEGLQLKASSLQGGVDREIYSDGDEGDKPQTMNHPRETPTLQGREEVSIPRRHNSNRASPVPLELGF
jgi:hypothetical protein